MTTHTCPIRFARGWLLVAGLAVLVPGAAAGQDGGHDHGAAAPGGALQAPPTVREEHDEIRKALQEATGIAGPVGEAARNVARLLTPHFVREEQIALPPLGVLRRLAEGQMDSGMLALVPLADSLRAELPGMLAEHASIRAAVEVLRQRAAHEGRLHVVELADRLAAHSRMEEEVTYPAAVLVGEVIRQRQHQREMMRMMNHPDAPR